MKPVSPPTARTGFTLIEVLVSLGLCALLATTVAAAVAFAARAEHLADRNGEAALLAQSLYAAQRLRPADAPGLPPGWRLEATVEISTPPDEPPRAWHLLAVTAPDRDIPPFTLHILDDAP
jgi:prepilin-type N-terminal cleavage/methylation domain-containing protein